MFSKAAESVGGANFAPLAQALEAAAAPTFCGLLVRDDIFTNVIVL